jgi:hypothetical protein
MSNDEEIYREIRVNPTLSMPNFGEKTYQTMYFVQQGADLIQKRLWKVLPKAVFVCCPELNYGRTVNCNGRDCPINKPIPCPVTFQSGF